ncbi:hypothetical protein KQX54_003132 [Cotesia glomerata]|uniref:Uncharacterized protein n=1 Tax=Cotesia glomerata TaxID=32391 RepID=A0AAV7IP72_COTGL|nr:hypothetical protein KQX54_003132 [Cotesia glomerata]
MQKNQVIEQFFLRKNAPRLQARNKIFFFTLLHPEAGLAVAAELKPPEERTKQERMAIMGKPKLGENKVAQVRIKESKEFKNTVDKLVQRANASIILGTSSWKEQFTEALTVSGGDDDDDAEADAEGRVSTPSTADYLMHSLTIFWKVLFAFVPPTKFILCGELNSVNPKDANGCDINPVGEKEGGMLGAVTDGDSLVVVVLLCVVVGELEALKSPGNRGSYCLLNDPLRAPLATVVWFNIQSDYQPRNRMHTEERL